MVKTAKTSTGRQNFSYSCPPDIFKRLTAVCDTRGCTKSWLITKALENYLAELEEDAMDYEIAVAAWKEFEASGSKGYTSEEARKMLGL